MNVSGRWSAMSNELMSRVFKVVALLCAIAAVSAASGAPPSAAVPRVRSAGPLAPTPTPTPALGSPASPYTQALGCPTSPMTVAVTPATLPVGWDSTGLGTALKGANISTFQGKLDLACIYRVGSSSEQILLRKFGSEPGSCIVNPTNTGFVCKPGSVK